MFFCLTRETIGAMNASMILAMGRKPTYRREISVFGQNLRRLRNRAGLGQQELADRAGVGRATVARLEVGAVAGPSHKTVEALAEVLGVAPSELWETSLVLPHIEAAIASFRRSHYAAILKPALSDDDLAHLRALAGSVWVNTRPTDETLYYMVMAHRSAH